MHQFVPRRLAGHSPGVPGLRIHQTRRFLLMGALVAAAVLISHSAVTASAAAEAYEAKIALLQTYEAPASAVLPTPARDAFAISSYTVVQWPVPSSTTMSSGFGYRSCDGCSSDHLGIDLNPGSGFPVQAIAAGTVVIARESYTGLGVEVVIEHSVDGEIVRSLYAHMQSGSLTVASGDTVSAGQRIGLVGSTGQSTGPHLHFGILRDGVEIDPLAWLVRYANL